MSVGPQTVLVVCDPPVLPPGQNSGGTHQGVSYLVRELQLMGHKVELLTRDVFTQTPKGCRNEYKYVAELLDRKQFTVVHIVTESRLGLYARRYCVEQGIPFTAFYGTLYPEWLNVRNGVPEWLPYSYIRWFCNAANRVIVPTPSLLHRVTDRGVKNVTVVPYGVDTDLFSPAADRDGARKFLSHLPRPLWLYVGRVTVEKGVPQLCALDLPGTIVICGEGDLMPSLKAKHPNVYFAGVQVGDDLVRHYRTADCFIFPSWTDTFGLVLLEALSCGVPVAALPETGPVDVITDPRVGVLDRDLRSAALKAVNLSPTDCRNFALGYTWRRSAEAFMAAQVPFYRDGPVGGVKVWWDRNVNFSMRLLEAAVRYYEHMLFGR